MTTEIKDFECCPPFDPKPWDEKLLKWDNKMFIKNKVCTFFYLPLNFGAAMKRLNATVEKASANIPDWLCLSDHTSKWNMDLLMAVDKEIPGSDMANLSGSFYSKVYEGNYNETGKWMSDFENNAKNNKMLFEKTYLWYTTCPKCAKKYGKNYTVIIGKLKTYE